MVIQRKQTLLLLAALILMGSLLFAPAATVTATGIVLTCSDFIVPFIMIIVTCLLILADVFMFKNLKRQMGLVWIIVALQAATAVFGGIQIANTPGLTFNWAETTVIPLSVSVILMVLAWYCMRRDRNLLRSVNRFR